MTSDVEESATYQGRTLIANSKQKVTVEMIDGEPLVTKMAMETTVKEVFESQESAESCSSGITEKIAEIISDLIDAIGLK